MKTTSLHSTKRVSVLLAALAFGLALAACGGGGGNPGAVGGVTTPTPTPGPTPTPIPTPKEPVLTLALVDGTGNPVTTLSGGQNATVKATVLSSAGTAAAGAIVTFSAGAAGLVEFNPVSGSALTDAKGVAVISIKPASFSAAGAVAVSASSVVETKTATATVNIAVGAAPLTVGALSFSPVPTGALPAFSTVALNVPVTSGGQPVNSVSGLTLTSLCVGDGTATLVPGTVANGVQVATYTNNGCLRGRDVITASVGNSAQSIALDVGQANIGSIQFITSGLVDQSIVLKGSGGLGRSESAQLLFRVVDQQNKPLPGVDVNFTATTNTGGLSVSPAKATSDASGNVTTMISSGSIPTPVRVIAEATRNGMTISGLSDTLKVSTGLPQQRTTSLSVDKYNIEGLGYDGESAAITIRMADQYGNPVSDGLAVNFVASTGAVGTSSQGACTTIQDGGCSVTYHTQGQRPLNGRVTVLAFAQGLEDFVDMNGDGQYSCTNFVDANGNVPPTYRPLVDTCLSGGEPFTDMGDPILDVGLDGSYDPAKGDLPFPYKHAFYTAAGDGKWGINYIRASAQIVLSGSNATLVRQVCTTAQGCRDWTAADGDPTLISGVAGPACSAQTLWFRIFDVNNNPLPAGTSVGGADVQKITPGTFAPDSVGSTNAPGGTSHKVNIKPDDNCAAGSFSVKITTPKGISSVFLFKSS